MTFHTQNDTNHLFVGLGSRGCRNKLIYQLFWFDSYKSELEEHMSVIVFDNRLHKRCIVVFLLFLASCNHGPLERGISLISVICWLFFDSVCIIEEMMDIENRERENARHHDVASAVMNLVCDYDPVNCKAIERFRPVVTGSRCLFAKGAKLW